jgi:hypothetical protein
LIAGAEPGVEDVIRVGISPGSLEIFDCTELAVGVDGSALQRVRPQELNRQFSKLKKAIVRVRLLNSGNGLVQPVIQEYRFKILVPDEASLATADQLFLEKLGVDTVDLAAVGSFYESSRDGLAAEYAEALADYVRAVLLKDGDPRTGVSTRLHHYHEIQSRALNILQSFNRPLAKLLCAVIRFNLNDFGHWQVPTAFADLDHAYSILGPLARPELRQSASWKSPSLNLKTQVFVCPVDVGTDTVTRLAKQSAELPRLGSAAEERFRALAEQTSVDSLDRAKIRALWGVTALGLGATPSANRALRLLDGDPTFGAWAAAKLSKVDP